MRDEEDSVAGVAIRDLLLDRSVPPNGIVVSPGGVVGTVDSVGVSDPVDAVEHSPVRELDNVGAQEGVGVGQVEAELVEDLVALGGGGGAADDKVLFIGVRDQLPSAGGVIVDGGDVADGEVERRSSGDEADGLVLLSALDELVVAVHLGPNLLHEGDPETPVGGLLGEEKGSVRGVVEGEVVVDSDDGGDSSDEAFYSDDTLLVVGLGDKGLSESLFELSHGSTAGQEVAISELALLDVEGLNLRAEEATRGEGMAGAPPHDEALLGLQATHVEVLPEEGIIRREGRIIEGNALPDNLSEVGAAALPPLDGSRAVVLELLVLLSQVLDELLSADRSPET